MTRLEALKSYIKERIDTMDIEEIFTSIGNNEIDLIIPIKKEILDIWEYETLLDKCPEYLKNVEDSDMSYKIMIRVFTEYMNEIYNI